MCKDNVSFVSSLWTTGTCCSSSSCLLRKKNKTHDKRGGFWGRDKHRERKIIREIDPVNCTQTLPHRPPAHLHEDAGTNKSVHYTAEDPDQPHGEQQSSPISSAQQDGFYCFQIFTSVFYSMSWYLSVCGSLLIEVSANFRGSVHLISFMFYKFSRGFETKIVLSLLF